MGIEAEGGRAQAEGKRQKTLSAPIACRPLSALRGLMNLFSARRRDATSRLPAWRIQEGARGQDATSEPGLFLVEG